jgi:acyl-CoA synthetase
LDASELSIINSTSGTTGTPKCVMHNQNRWWYFHQLAVEAGALTSDDVFYSAVPMPFGFGLWTSHFTPAYLGAPVGVSSRFSPSRMLEAIESQRTTVLACVSSQFIMMLTAAESNRFDLSSLRVMFTGGEAVPYDRAAQFEDRFGVPVLQFYGSNETGALSRTTLADNRNTRLRTAGSVIDGMDVILLDSDRRRVPPRGSAGQPACRGPATSLGYWDDDDANRQLFTDDGWMLMGDIVEIDAAGLLRVVGRVADFIIRGGKNVSAPYVEAEVASHPAVALAAAVPDPDPVLGERVGVYVTLKDGCSLSLEELVAHLRARGASKDSLPERLTVLDEMPMSSGGKIAKGLLRARAAS